VQKKKKAPVQKVMAMPTLRPRETVKERRMRTELDQRTHRQNQ
jgi:hypothetical protein